MENKQKIIVTCVMAVAVVVGCALLGKGLTNFHKSNDTINVTGKAEKTIDSDYVVWRITLNSTGADRQTAYHNYETDIAALKNFLDEQHIPANEMTEQSPSASERIESSYKNGNYVTEKLGYQVTQTLTISTSDLAMVEKAYNKISTLYSTGMDIDSSPLEYYYTKLNDLKMEMLKDASADAYARAQVLAEGCDAEVGKLTNLSMGVFQILGVNCNEDYSWGGTYNTSSKKKEASITVRAEYESK